MAAAFGYFPRMRLARAVAASGLLSGAVLMVFAATVVRPAAQGIVGPGAQATSAANVASAEPPLIVAALDLPSHRLHAHDITVQLEQGLRAVRTRGARLAVLPGPFEFNAGRDNPRSPAGEAIPGSTTIWAGDIARSLGMWIALPVFERSDDPETGGNPFLTMVLVNPGGKVEYKGRAVLPNPAFDAVHVARGSYRDTLQSIDVGHLRIGLLSGSEAMTAVMRLSDLGADIILVASNLLDVEGRDRLVTLARRANVNIAVANRSSRDSANAFIIDARGDLIGDSVGDGWIVGAVSAVANNEVGSAALGLPSTVPRPKRFSATGSGAELGRKLFLDTRLSLNGKVACVTCHRPSLGFSNGAARGEGVDGHKTKRNVAGLLNVAYRPLLRWDGYASSLENFIKYPIIGTHEMNSGDLDRLVRLVRSDSEYRDGFARVFGAKEIMFENIEVVLADYMRTLTSANSPFDRFYFGRDASALSTRQRRGFDLFVGKGGCAQCHPVGERHTLLTDYEYHDLGVGWRAETASYDDIGLGGISTAKQSGRFLTPSLRDVARTAPYMHDGSIATLKDVVEFFNHGGNPSPGRDPRVVPLGLSERDKADLVAFLESLTGEATWDDLGRATLTREEGQ